jgi:hypothetical protein
MNSRPRPPPPRPNPPPNQNQGTNHLPPPTPGSFFPDPLLAPPPPQNPSNLLSLNPNPTPPRVPPRHARNCPPRLSFCFMHRLSTSYVNITFLIGLTESVDLAGWLCQALSSMTLHLGLRHIITLLSRKAAATGSWSRWAMPTWSPRWQPIIWQGGCRLVSRKTLRKWFFSYSVGVVAARWAAAEGRACMAGEVRELGRAQQCGTPRLFPLSERASPRPPPGPPRGGRPSPGRACPSRGVLGCVVRFSGNQNSQGVAAFPAMNCCELFYICLI